MNENRKVHPILTPFIPKSSSYNMETSNDRTLFAVIFI